MALKLLDNVFHPDVLSCLADLSNDEVFTPPKVAKEMLDMLPQELFRNPNTKFLDPACKSGIFLREITERLNEGLKDIIPDPQKRIDHILHNQVYGIAITQITALLSRRSVYCSKDASGQYSLSHFDSSDGNVRFKDIKHTWEKGSCKFCGASKSSNDRENGKETHAYEFIHKDIKEIVNMKFDVIISNPPYQLSTAGSVESQATPIYQKFIGQAKKMNPHYLVMIVPSRWMNGGFGLDSFRSEMLNDKRISILHDYFNAVDCFPGIALTGGVCYFLWDKNHNEKCVIYSHSDNRNIEKSVRYLLEPGLETFIRFNDGISILNKVRSFKEKSFSDIVSQRDPFGLNYYEDGRERMFKIFSNTKTKDNVHIYSFGWQKVAANYADKKYITTNKDAVSKFKVYISKANGAASSKAPYAVLSKPFVGEPNSICNMTYLMVGPFNFENEAYNVVQYMTTKFFRFLVSLLKNTQNAYKKVYTYVPMQDFSKSWTDVELYKKYGLTQKEIDFIESMIKPMEMGGDSNG